MFTYLLYDHRLYPGLEKMSVLTVPWFEYELFVQYYNGSAHVSATYKNFSVRSNGGSYVISYDAFIDGAVGKVRFWYLLYS